MRSPPRLEHPCEKRDQRPVWIARHWRQNRSGGSRLQHQQSSKRGRSHANRAGARAAATPRRLHWRTPHKPLNALLNHPHAAGAGRGSYQRRRAASEGFGRTKGLLPDLRKRAGQRKRSSRGGDGQVIARQLVVVTQLAKGRAARGELEGRIPQHGGQPRNKKVTPRSSPADTPQRSETNHASERREQQATSGEQGMH